MNAKSLLVSTAIVLISSIAHSANIASIAHLRDLKTVQGQTAELNLTSKKGVAVVFLSSVCPCSNSHIKELADLASKNPDFQFVGVHSNSNEDAETAKKYFESVALPFPILRDADSKIANEFGALKTPHAFLLDSNGKVLYRGGVSNSHIVDRADKKFLRDALEDVHQNRTVRTPEGRTLGCAIARGAGNAH